METRSRRWLRLAVAVKVIFVVFIVLTIYGISNNKSPLKILSIYSREDRASVAQQRTLTEKTFQGLDQDDPALVTYITHLINSPTNKPYNLSEPQKIHYSQFGQSSYADTDILNGMKDGFFVEVGAVDGEFLSNTLYFERNRGWTGLLIEAFPETYKQLLSKHRKAYSINAALALNNVSSEVIFTPSGHKGVLGQIGNSTSAIKVKAFPLYSILLSLNVTVVDFFSLDIEGVEMKVLRTIPWDKIKFRLMCVEINHVPEGANAVTEYMKLQGYKFLGIKEIDAWFGWPDLLKQTMKKI
ncbi:protein Star-like [Cherax quadricarinatus]|uniref:protein Star-like n=1 Tax=Cherax quadricarinatus TaxID=27406 RepID=UPI00387EDB22